MRGFGLHQNRPAHASKLIRFRVIYQHMLVSLLQCTGERFQNLVNLIAYADQLWMSKSTYLFGSVLMQVTSFFFE